MKMGVGAVPALSSKEGATRENKNAFGSGLDGHGRGRYLRHVRRRIAARLRRGGRIQQMIESPWTLKYQKITDLLRSKARTFMYTALIIFGFLQIVAGAFLDIILYGLAILTVMFFTKISRK